MNMKGAELTKGLSRTAEHERTTARVLLTNARLRSGLSLQHPAGTWTNGFLYDAAKPLANVTSQTGAFAYSYSAGV